MPPINIRELFLADADLIKVDKINYNFDQILANGGGPIGPKGQKGEIGPPGNTGIQGNDGEKGQKGEKGDSAAAGASNWGRIDYSGADDADILKPIRLDDANDDPVSIVLGDGVYEVGSNDGLADPKAWLTILKPDDNKYANYISFLRNDTSMLRIKSETLAGTDKYEISYGASDPNTNIDLDISIKNKLYLNGPDSVEIKSQNTNGKVASAIINGVNNTIKLDTNGTSSIELGANQLFSYNSNNSINIDANGAITSTAGVFIYDEAPIISLIGTSTITLVGNQGSSHGIRVDNEHVAEGGTKIKGNVTWKADDPVFQTTGPDTHYSIFIDREGLDVDQSPVYIQSVTDDDADFTGLVVSTALGKGDFGDPAINSTVVHNTGVVIDSNSDSTSVEGFRFDGWDSTSGRDHKQFHVHRGVTEIGNRLMFTRRHLNINAATEGITEADGYEVPSEYMDATYLDITISSSGEPVPRNHSDDIWDLKLPNGLYEGQRLILHITAAPCSDGIVPPDPSSLWPSLDTIGKINVKIKSSSSGNSTQYEKIAEMHVSNIVNDGLYGSEFIVELLWSGRVYSTSLFDGSNNALSRTSGWMIMNGINILNDGLDGDYNSVKTDLQFIT